MEIYFLYEKKKKKKKKKKKEIFIVLSLQRQPSIIEHPFDVEQRY